MTVRCVHNMVKEACAFCSPPRKPRVPAKSMDRIVSIGDSAGSVVDVERYGLAVVHTVKKSRTAVLVDISRMGDGVEVVHFDGQPFVWAIEALIEKAKGLKTIQLIPAAYYRFRGRGRELCDAARVQVVAGRVREELAWEDGRVGNPLYDEQRHFMERLSGEQKLLFDELIALGFAAAEVTSRYFCLRGEEYVPQRLIAEEFGYAKGHVSVISAMVLSVFRYLDETVEVGEISKRRARSMQVRADKLRPLLASAEERRRVAREIGVPRLPASLPLARIGVYRAVLGAFFADGLARLSSKHQRAYEAIVLRFVLQSLDDPTYRTLSEVGDLMGGITRERVRQLEEIALKILGIEDES